MQKLAQQFLSNLHCCLYFTGKHCGLCSPHVKMDAMRHRDHCYECVAVTTSTVPGSSMNFFLVSKECQYI